jgi:citronellol/citronellal dehydrogenase
MGGDTMMKASRKPDIMADAAHWILTQKSTACTGNFFVDEDMLRSKCGVQDFEKYVVLWYLTYVHGHVF